MKKTTLLVLTVLLVLGLLIFGIVKLTVSTHNEPKTKIMSLIKEKKQGNKRLEWLKKTSINGKNGRKGLSKGESLQMKNLKKMKDEELRHKTDVKNLREENEKQKNKIHHLQNLLTKQEQVKK